MTRFGLACPTDPAHGALLPLVKATAQGEGWYCPNQTHDRSGARPFFTTAAAEAPRVAEVAAPLGVSPSATPVAPSARGRIQSQAATGATVS